MRELKDKSELPWCLIGDFNNVMAQVDKRGGNPYPNWLLEGFQRAVDDCGLLDLDLIGYQYTWERGRGTDGWIEVRLDREMTTVDWVGRFRLARLFNLQVSLSDHCAIYLDSDYK